MEITKPVLQVRHAAMTQQLGRLLEETAMVRGAINLCEALMDHLATPEAEPPEPDPEGTPQEDPQDGPTDALRVLGEIGDE